MRLQIQLHLFGFLVSIVGNRILYSILLSIMRFKVHVLFLNLTLDVVPNTKFLYFFGVVQCVDYFLIINK